MRTIDCADPHGGPLGCVERNAAENCLREFPDWWELTFAHGTGIASILSGNISGAARPEIVSVNIVPCNASVDPHTKASYTTSGLDWIAGDVTARKSAGPFRSVVNHSGFVSPWDQGDSGVVMNAVRKVVGLDVPYFTSADNFSGDACAFTPNMYTYTRNQKHWTKVVFTVAGTTMNGGVQNGRMTGTTDVPWQTPRADWDTPIEPGETIEDWQKRVRDTGTNLGDCVSAFAPAVHIWAAAHQYSKPQITPTPDGNEAYYHLWKSGTSWSAPLAAALALRWMATQPTVPSYTATYDYLLNTGLTTVGLQGVPVSNDAYTICFNPNNDNDWEYFAAANHTCDTTLTRSSTYRMPAVTNSSDARMIFWNGTTSCQ